MNALELGKQRAKELGLVGGLDSRFQEYAFYQADDIHKLLGEGVEVGRYKAGLSMSAWAISHMDHAEETALLIGIRPIVQEAEERKLLREFSQYVEWQHTNGKPSLWDLVARAKTLLEKP